VQSLVLPAAVLNRPRLSTRHCASPDVVATLSCADQPRFNCGTDEARSLFMFLHAPLHHCSSGCSCCCRSVQQQKESFEWHVTAVTIMQTPMPTYCVVVHCHALYSQAQSLAPEAASLAPAASALAPDATTLNPAAATTSSSTSDGPSAAAAGQAGSGKVPGSKYRCVS
jgi:hypothetical protein